MGAFFSKHQYLIIWISALIIIGAIAILIIQLNGYFLPTATSLHQPTPAPSVSAPSLPPAPSVTLTIQGKNLLVQWQNLPGGTTALNIFRSKKNTNDWELWKTIQLNVDQLLDGSQLLNLGLNGSDYSYYFQAVGGNSDDNSTSTENILWTSSSTDPGNGTSTNQNGGGGGNGGAGNGNNGGGGSNGNSSSSGQGQGGNNGNGGGGSNGNSSGTGGGSGPGGNAYYNPQIQVTGYGADNGNFWVQHASQSIEIGWQDLPSSTDSITVTRSQNQNGPWDQILQEQNPGTTGSYSLELVDGTVDEPYYYEMNVYQGTTLLATYGPDYLAPAGQ